MSKSSKKSFRFTSKVIVRLGIFIVLFLVSIYYLSIHSPQNSNILGEQTFVFSELPIVKSTIDSLYNNLPPKSREFVENFNDSPVILMAQKKIDFIKNESAGFPQKQIQDVKMFFINKSRSILDNAAKK